MTKICSNCSTEKEIGEFYLDRGKPHSQCKECIKTKTKKYKDNNKEKYQKYFKEYQEKNKDHIIPISSVKNKKEIININHYTNLQPLCSKINREIKKDKLEYEI